MTLQGSGKLEAVCRVARRLAGLERASVFVGGAVIELLITDPGAPRVRPTLDVDVVVDVESYAGYWTTLAGRLRELGFREDLEVGAPLGRWVVEGTKVDVLAPSPEPLGMTNRWFGPALAHAYDPRLPGGPALRVATAPYLLATKVEAFRGRGKGDYQASADLEDIAWLVDGRTELVVEVERSGPGLREYLSRFAAELLDSPAFHEALPGLLPPDHAAQARVPEVRRRITRLARGRGL